ncbi:MAG: DUF2339 domain-containing protein [Clostridia bacterium]|nr:DUF2339 domain-containing protein [Clostridia bacterium]
MELKEKLRNLMETQKNLIKEYESTVVEFAESDLIHQNIELKREVEQYKIRIEELEKKYRETMEKNQNLSTALKEQVLDEKLNILKISKNKLEIYFHHGTYHHLNRLAVLEDETRHKIQNLKNIASKELSLEKEAYINEIDRLERELKKRIQDQKEKFLNHIGDTSQEMNTQLDALKNEGVSEEVIRRRIRQNNMEVKIGLSWVNKVGILLILIGVATALKYTYSNFMGNEMRGVFAFLIGGVFLLGGEWFSRKEKSIFAQGLTGGGIGVLYLSIFSSFFILKIISLNVALVTAVLVTLTALVLSLRYNSRTICTLALIGGFLPFFTYEFAFKLDSNGIFIAMGYLFILNLLTLFISLYKKWDIVNYTSFLLNVPSLIYLVFKTPFEVAGAVYSLITFAMYLMITLAYPYKFKIKLKMIDITLMALNTLISCIVIFLLFEKAHLSDLRGVLSLAFCLIYFGLGQFLTRFMKEEKITKVLFYLTSYAFAVLVFPFQFGIKWFAMGWLVEGVLMVIYGYWNKSKYLEIGGWIIFGFCLSSVLSIDFVRYELVADKESVPHFHFRYLAIMAGLTYTLLMYLFEMKKGNILRFSIRGKLVTGLKYFTTLNVWVYLIYTANSFYSKWMVDEKIIGRDHESFFRLILFSIITILFSFLITKIPVLYDKIIRNFSVFLFLLADLMCVIVSFIPVFEPHQGNLKYLAVGIVIAFNVFAFLSIRDLLIRLIRELDFSLEAYPLIIAVYLLSMSTGLLTVQFNLGKLNLLFSLLYLVAAFLCILYGFMKKYIWIRRFGLGLSFFSTAKLFIYDLAFLKTEGRIVAYFIFGILLIGISFAYQKLGRCIEATNKNGEGVVG